MGQGDAIFKQSGVLLVVRKGHFLSIFISIFLLYAPYFLTKKVIFNIMISHCFFSSMTSHLCS